MPLRVSAPRQCIPIVLMKSVWQYLRSLHWFNTALPLRSCAPTHRISVVSLMLMRWYLTCPPGSNPIVPPRAVNLANDASMVLGIKGGVTLGLRVSSVL
jgi:hypothetical protein